VIGDVPAAVRFKKLDALLSQNMLAHQQMLPLAVPAQRDYMRMLAKEQHILDCSGLPRLHKPLLQRTRFGVSNESEINLEQLL
jgi:hypothetical protein